MADRAAVVAGVPVDTAVLEALRALREASPRCYAAFAESLDAAYRGAALVLVNAPEEGFAQAQGRAQMLRALSLAAADPARHLFNAPR